MDNNKQAGLINPASINTEEKLTNFLTQIGFNSRYITKEHSDARVWLHYRGAILPLQRELSWEDNEGFESYAVISIEKETLYIQYYQEENEHYDIWEEFSGEVEIEAIRKSIRSAVTRKDIAIRFHYFWPERIVTAESLGGSLEHIGFKSHEVSWPSGLPSMGESVNTPHGLILGKEHNLDTDAIVSLENLTVYVYYRDPSDNNYKEWAKLDAKKNFPGQLPYVEYSILHSALITAMTAKKETEKFMG